MRTNARDELKGGGLHVIVIDGLHLKFLTVHASVHSDVGIQCKEGVGAHESGKPLRYQGFGKPALDFQKGGRPRPSEHQYSTRVCRVAAVLLAAVTRTWGQLELVLRSGSLYYSLPRSADADSYGSLGRHIFVTVVSLFGCVSTELLCRHLLLALCRCDRTGGYFRVCTKRPKHTRNHVKVAGFASAWHPL